MGNAIFACRLGHFYGAPTAQPSGSGLVSGFSERRVTVDRTVEGAYHMFKPAHSGGPSVTAANLDSCSVGRHWTSAAGGAVTSYPHAIGWTGSELIGRLIGGSSTGLSESVRSFSWASRST